MWVGAPSCRVYKHALTGPFVHEHKLAFPCHHILHSKIQALLLNYCVACTLMLCE